LEPQAVIVLSGLNGPGAVVIAGFNGFWAICHLALRGESQGNVCSLALTDPGQLLTVMQVKYPPGPDFCV
jgi:hypothetical protein